MINSFSIGKYGEEHIPQTVQWLNQQDIREFFGITYNVNADEHRLWMQKNTDVEFLPLYCDKNYVGNIVLNNLDRHSSTYLQIYIGEDKFRGMGLGQAFMILALKYIFTVKKYHRVWLHVRDSNRRALKLYQGLGFVNEGLERESIKDHSVFISQHRMSLLSTEFKDSL